MSKATRRTFRKLQTHRGLQRKALEAVEEERQRRDKARALGLHIPSLGETLKSLPSERVLRSR